MRLMIIPLIIGTCDPESIVPKFVFRCFPIFAVRLSHFVTKENNSANIKWTSLIAKNIKQRFAKKIVW